MIKEDYVSFETAKLLKEKEFDGECSRFYMPNGHGRGKYEHYHDFDISDRIECPTHQMAMKWLREVHKIFILIEQHMDMSYMWFTYQDGTWKGCDRQSNNNSYEEACEVAIKYCLEKLI